MEVQENVLAYLQFEKRHASKEKILIANLKSFKTQWEDFDPFCFYYQHRRQDQRVEENTFHEIAPLGWKKNQGFLYFKKLVINIINFMAKLFSD